MNTGTAANVQGVEPVAWMRTDGFGNSCLPDEFLRKYPEYRYQFKEPLYTAASLSAITADRDRLREALRQLLNDTQHSEHDCGDHENCPVLAARKALEQSQ